MRRKTETMLRKVFDEKSLEKQLSEIDEEINDLLEEKETLRKESVSRIQQVKAWEDAGSIKILGHVNQPHPCGR